MSENRRQAILFASAPPWRAAELLTKVRQRWPDHDWTVCVKAHERGWLPPECPMVTLPRLRPGLTAARRVRRGKFDVSIALWSGEKGYARLKVLHVGTPARERHVYNENLDSFQLLPGEEDPPWLRHVRWRLGRRQERSRIGLFGLAGRLYGATLGPVLGFLFLCGKHMLWSAGLGPRARA